MKKIVATLLLFISFIGYSQTNGITYQAVIINPSGEELPGVNNTNAPLANKNICLKFSILNQNSQFEYIETIQTTTDEFGMVNLIIGTGVRIGGSATSFSNIVWNTNPKRLKVDLSTTGLCSTYTEISNQPFTAVPFALFAASSGTSAVTAGPAGPQGPQGIQGIQGVAGSTGATGPQGIQGAAGTNGTNGTNGLDGKSVLNGTSNPSPADGANGDFFINTTTNTIYGPKASGAWPSTGTNLVGPAGPAGINGINGLDGAVGPQGPQGIQGLAGTNGTDGAVGPQGIQGEIGPQGLQGDIGLQGPAGSDATVIIGPISTSSDSNGATVTAGELNLAPADGNNGGIVTTSDQTFAGNKSFVSDIVVNGLTIGKGAGQNEHNTAIGFEALNSSNAIGTRNTAVGVRALRNYSGTSYDNNTGVGYNSMLGLTTGDGNTSVGAETMFSVATGKNNTGIGNQSLISTSGNNNVGVGYRSGEGLTTGSDNTFLGTQAKTTSAGATVSNATAIGFGAQVETNNTIQLGNLSVTKVNTSGSYTGSGFKTPTGTSTQYLMANGSVSSGVTVGAISASSNANGATITTGVLNLAPANASNGGVVTTGNQTFAGSKTFSNTIGGSISGNAATVTNGVYTTNKLNVLAATTSTELAGVISDETGTGKLVLSDSPTFTGIVSGINKTMVGLSNIDNTSDASKPISTLTQAALDLKQNALTNPVTGTGTTNTLPKFTGTSTVGNSNISDNGTVVSVFGNLLLGTTTDTGAKLQVNGAYTNASSNDEVSDTTIDFSLSNIAFTSATSNAISLTNIKDGGVYNLVTTANNVSNSVSFTLPVGFTIRYMGTSNRTIGKIHLYRFVVAGTNVLVTMSTEN